MEATTPPTPTENQKPKTRVATILLSFLLVLVASAASYGGHMLWLAQQGHKGELTTLKKDLAQSQASVRKLSQANASILTQQQLLTQTMSEATKRTEAQLTTLTKQLGAIKGSTRKDWLLAEAEYLLRIANQRLFIENDPKASESLLNAADSVLNELADPSLMPVRVAIAEEVFQLQTNAGNNIDTLYSQLSALSNAVYALDLAHQGSTLKPEPAETAAKDETSTLEQSGLDRFLQKLRNVFSKAVTIQRRDEVIDAPPSPDFAEYLKQNLSLKLEQIKLSLVKQNGVRYQQELSDTLTWSKQNLPSTNLQAQQIITNLENLASQKLSWEKPDISKSLNLLQARIEEMYQTHTLSKLSSNQAKAIKSDEEPAK